MRTARSVSGDPRTPLQRVVVAVIALASVVASPILAVYELIIGLVVVVVAAALRRPESRRAVHIGFALLAGPTAYAMAWLFVRVFD